jgi:hypothetical protein
MYGDPEGDQVVSTSMSAPTIVSDGWAPSISFIIGVAETNKVITIKTMVERPMVANSDGPAYMNITSILILR